jgi:predicted phage tail protein
MVTTVDHPPTAPASPTGTSPGDTITPEDIGFGKAILWGSIVGIVVLGAMCFVAIRIVGSSISVMADLGISIWVGIWGGLFLGGTIAVGRWTMRQTGH